MLEGDLMFKYVFHFKEYVRDFLESYFEFVEEEHDLEDIKVDAQKIIMSGKRSLKDYYSDIVITCKKEIIILEMYTSFGKREINKSLLYQGRMLSNQVTRNKGSYDNVKKVISINLISGSYGEEKITNQYKLINKESYKNLRNDVIEFVTINIDKVKTTQYNEKEKRFIRWLRIINAKSLEEIENIAKGDEIMEKAEWSVRDFLDDPQIQEDFSYERYIKEKHEDIGEKKGKKEVAKKMYKEGIPEDTITKITGLPLNEFV